jgi:hypothetical protein
MARRNVPQGCLGLEAARGYQEVDPAEGISLTGSLPCRMSGEVRRHQVDPGVTKKVTEVAPHRGAADSLNEFGSR